MNLSHVVVRPVEPSEETRFQGLMDKYHYLGALSKIGNTIWYVATCNNEWLSLLSFSASALKCSARDSWVGWGHRLQYDRLHLVANNSRFLILPNCHHKNLASKTLSLCKNRIQQDWQTRFGFPLLMLETFVDPTRYIGTIYRAANWEFVGQTKGFQRIHNGYSNTRHTSKLVFVTPLQRNACRILSNPSLPPQYVKGVARMKLTAEQMRSLPEFFKDIRDPRRPQGRRHYVHVVLALAAGAVLCGMRSYKSISDWTKALSPTARARFGCYFSHRKNSVPSESTIRNVMIRVDPLELDQALQRWNAQFGIIDQSLAIDGKTMRNAIDDNGRQIHIMGVVGHQSKHSYTQKKSAPCR